MSAQDIRDGHEGPRSSVPQDPGFKELRMGDVRLTSETQTCRNNECRIEKHSGKIQNQRTYHHRLIKMKDGLPEDGCRIKELGTRVADPRKSKIRSNRSEDCKISERNTERRRPENCREQTIMTEDCRTKGYTPEQRQDRCVYDERIHAEGLSTKRCRTEVTEANMTKDCITAKSATAGPTTERCTLCF